MAAGKVDLVIRYGVIPGTTDPFKIGTSGDPYQGTGAWKSMSDPHKESRRIIHSNDGPFTVTRDRNKVTFAFSFMTVQRDETDLKNDVQLIETVFSQRWQDVSLEINGEEQYSFSHNSATGFESTASISKGSGATAKAIDGSFSRNYRATITVGLPHDQNYGADEGIGATGLANSSVSVSFNASNKKTVTISGAYSAMPVDGSPAYENPNDEDESTQTGAAGLPGSIYARDQFEDQISDYCGAVLVSIDDGAEFEIASQKTDVKDSVLTEAGIARGKMLTFNRVYVELFYEEGPGPYEDKPNGDAGTFDASKIKEQSLSITPKINRSGAMGKGCKSTYGIPLVSATVVYVCTFDRMEFNGGGYLTIEDLQAEYNLLRPWLIEKVKESFVGWGKVGQGSFFVMTENVGYNCDAYKITATLGVAALADSVGLGGDAEFPARSLIYTLTRNFGKTLVPIWDRNSEYSRYAFQGAASRTLTMTESWKSIGSDQDQALQWAKPDWKQFAPRGKGWKFVVKSVVKDHSPLKQGIEPDAMVASSYSQKYTVEYYTEVGAAISAGPSRTAVNRPRVPDLGLPGAGEGAGGGAIRFGGD